jgi:hypothetical protein
MKTNHIESTFRNATSPAVRLAAWQSRRTAWRLRELREEMAEPYREGETLATLRASRIHSQGPELSAPEAEKPLLWLSGESDVEIRDCFPGREFLDHRGWFTDEFESDTLETYAVRLARFPRLMFYGVMSEGGLRVELSKWEEIDFSDCQSEHQTWDAIRESAREIARCNDSSTEREAETEREYQRKWRIENDMEENRETLKSLRGEIRALAHELKSLCPSPMAGEFPAAAKALRDGLRSLLRDRARIMGENEKLATEL